jgi:hypothetical protein
MMQHIHQYEYRDAGPHSNEIVRDRLRQKPRQTFETVDEAVAWHQKWMNETVRPGGVIDLDGAGQDAAKARLLMFTRSQLEHGQHVMDGFWSGQQFIAATLIPCPAREIPGFPAPPPCPLGRH